MASSAPSTGKAKGQRRTVNGDTGQLHQNKTTYKSDKYCLTKDSLRTKQIAMPVGGVCARCKDILDWKKKYDKYKPLTAPGRW